MLPIQPQPQKAPQRQSVQLPEGAEVIKSEHKKFNQEEAIQKLNIEPGKVKQRMSMFEKKPEPPKTYVPSQAARSSLKPTVPSAPSNEQQRQQAPQSSTTNGNEKGPVVEQTHDLMHLSVKERIALMQKRGSQVQQVEFPRKSSVKIDQPVNLQERMKAFQSGAKKELEDQGSIYQQSSPKQEEPQQTDQTTPEKPQEQPQENQEQHQENHEQHQEQEQTQADQQVTQQEDNQHPVQHQEAENNQHQAQEDHNTVTHQETENNQQQEAQEEQQNELNQSLPIITKTLSNTEVPQQQEQQQANNEEEQQHQPQEHQQQQVSEEHQQQNQQEQPVEEIANNQQIEQTVEEQEQN